MILNLHGAIQFDRRRSTSRSRNATSKLYNCCCSMAPKKKKDAVRDYVGTGKQVLYDLYCLIDLGPLGDALQAETVLCGATK